jgi:hypothetical protein
MPYLLSFIVIPHKPQDMTMKIADKGRNAIGASLTNFPISDAR